MAGGGSSPCTLCWRCRLVIGGICDDSGKENAGGAERELLENRRQSLLAGEGARLGEWCLSAHGSVEAM